MSKRKRESSESLSVKGPPFFKRRINYTQLEPHEQRFQGWKIESDPNAMRCCETMENILGWDHKMDPLEPYFVTYMKSVLKDELRLLDSYRQLIKEEIETIARERSLISEVIENALKIQVHKGLVDKYLGRIQRDEKTLKSLCIQTIRESLRDQKLGMERLKEIPESLMEDCLFPK